MGVKKRRPLQKNKEKNIERKQWKKKLKNYEIKLKLMLIRRSEKENK